LILPLILCERCVRRTFAISVFLEKKERRRQFMGYKFLRQHPVFYEYYGKRKFFIADFYCHELKLVVEIDGGIHEKQKDYDRLRSEILESQKGLRVIRFNNEEVLKEINKDTFLQYQTS